MASVIGRVFLTEGLQFAGKGAAGVGIASVLSDSLVEAMPYLIAGVVLFVVIKNKKSS
jgi:mannose/fructose/N-acetylgalactosamine-specific phosphotransferase system component IIC